MQNFQNPYINSVMTKEELEIVEIVNKETKSHTFL